MSCVSIMDKEKDLGYSPKELADFDYVNFNYITEVKLKSF